MRLRGKMSSLCYRYAVIAAQLLWVIRTCVSGSTVSVISPSLSSFHSFFCLIVKGTSLFFYALSLFAENTASVCTFLTTTHSFCRTSCRSCWIFLQNRMSVSYTVSISCLSATLHTAMKSYACLLVSGDQGLIHNLILDSRIIGQLASRVWKNKDLNSWVTLFTYTKNVPVRKRQVIAQTKLIPSGTASWLCLHPQMEE